MVGHIYILDGVIYLCNILTKRVGFNMAPPSPKYPHATVYCGVMIPINFDSFIIRDWLIYGFDGIKCLDNSVYKALVFTSDSKFIEIILSVRNGEKRAVANTLLLDKNTRYGVAEDSVASSMLVTALYANESVEETKKGLKSMTEKLYPFKQESIIEWPVEQMMEVATRANYTPFSSPETWRKK